VIIATGFTVPLLLCYPHPSSSEDGKGVAAIRRFTYQFYAAGELGLGTMMLIQYLQGDSGLTENALLFGAFNMGAYLGMRAFFLYMRPSWMEAQANARKAQ
jgi:hypothetical protein